MIAVVSRAAATSWVRKFLTFGVIGGLGTLVNLAVFVGLNKALMAAGGHGDTVITALPGGDFSLRYDHLFICAAFVVANMFNFVLNWWLTFGTSTTTPLKGMAKFMVIGVVSVAVQITAFSLLSRPTPLQLPTGVFDNSSGLRNIRYWAQLLSIVIAMPVNFVGNALWTFSASHRGTQRADRVAVSEATPTGATVLTVGDQPSAA